MVNTEDEARGAEPDCISVTTRRVEGNQGPEGKATLCYRHELRVSNPGLGRVRQQPENDDPSILQPIELSGCSDGF